MIPTELVPRKFNAPKKLVRKGLLIIYTGDGKGKSTAAFGVALRALGRGKKVAIVQFMKGKWVSGEIQALKKFGKDVEIHSVGEGFTWETKELKKDISLAERAWRICLQLLKSGRHQVYIFDELLYVLKYKFLSLEMVLKGLKLKDPQSHLLLTGRDAPPQLIRQADLVTEMKEIKHPYHSGIPAQPGVDY